MAPYGTEVRRGTEMGTVADCLDFGLAASMGVNRSTRVSLSGENGETGREFGILSLLLSRTPGGKVSDRSNSVPLGS